MTPEQVFRELLGRIGASKGNDVLVSEEDLAAWPDSALKVLKDVGLLRPASPATSVICPGCEQECSMSVVERATGSTQLSFFVVCDKREDISRVPILPTKLRRWIATPLALGSLIARDLSLADTVASNGPRCEMGTLRGRRGSSHLVLIADGKLRLSVAGHNVELENIVTLTDGAIKIDRRALERFTDNPIAGGGDDVSAEARRKRIVGAVKTEIAKGNRAFLKTVAEREGISVTRVKQMRLANSSTKEGSR